MEWSDNEIDNLFQEAASSQNVTYSESYWKEMEALLDGEKASKRGFIWWFLGSFVALAAVGGYVFYLSNSNVTSKNQKVALTKDQKTQQTTSENELKINDSDDRQLSYNLMGIDGLIEQPEKAVGTHDSKVVSSQKAIKSQSLSVKTAGVNLKSRSYQATNAIQGDVLSATDVKEIENVVKNQQMNEKPEFYEEKYLELENDSKQEVQEQISENKEDSIMDILEDQSDKDQVVSVVEGEQVPEVDLLLKNKKLKYYVGLGLGEATSYRANSSNLTMQWRAKMGIEYNVSSNFSIGGGLGFRQQFVNDLTIDNSRNYYSLGLISVEQYISYDRLLFADVNVHAHYRYRKIGIGAELTPSYLIGARSVVTQGFYENETLVQGSQKNDETRYVHSDNFNAFGFDLGLSVQYEFKHQLYLEFIANTRLNKLLNNPLFIGEERRCPVRIELNLIKKF